MMKKLMYRVYVYEGDLASTNVREIWYSRSKSVAYAKLQEYLEKHPECVKAYVDENFE